MAKESTNNEQQDVAFGASARTDDKSQVASESEITSSNPKSRGRPAAKPKEESSSYYGDDLDDTEIQEAFSKARLSYDRASIFPKIPARPGFTNFWGCVRDAMGRELSGKSSLYESKGWRTRHPSTVPFEFRSLQTDFGGYSSGVIMVRGNILYEMPQRLHDMLEADEKESANRGETQAVDNLREEAGRMGMEMIIDNRSGIERKQISDFG